MEARVEKKKAKLEGKVIDTPKEKEDKEITKQKKTILERIKNF